MQQAARPQGGLASGFGLAGSGGGIQVVQHPAAQQAAAVDWRHDILEVQVERFTTAKCEHHFGKQCSPCGVGAAVLHAQQ